MDLPFLEICPYSMKNTMKSLIIGKTALQNNTSTPLKASMRFMHFSLAMFNTYMSPLASPCNNGTN